MKKRNVALLKQILETPSPTGNEERLSSFLREHLSGIADEVTTDSMGSVHAILDKSMQSFDMTEPSEQEVIEESEDSADNSDEIAQESALIEEGDVIVEEDFEPLTMMLSVHMDEVGLMVQNISSQGYIQPSALGGVDAAILPGLRVDVHAYGETLNGVVGRIPIHMMRGSNDPKTVTPINELFVDLGMKAKDVFEKVTIGDAITYGYGFERLGEDMFASRAIDDKCGVFIGCKVMESLKEDAAYDGRFVCAMTVQEEIGTRGAITSAYSIYPDVAIAFDVTHATDYPGCDQSKFGNIACGSGPVIARGPNINPVVFSLLVECAEELGIEYQLEAEPSVTGTDARSIQVAHGGIPTGLVSIPVRYMHTPSEVACLDDIEGAIALIAAFAKKVMDAEGFVPGISAYVKPNAVNNKPSSPSGNELKELERDVRKLKKKLKKSLEGKPEQEMPVATYGAFRGANPYAQQRNPQQYANGRAPIVNPMGRYAARMQPQGFGPYPAAQGSAQGMPYANQAAMSQQAQMQNGAYPQSQATPSQGGMGPAGAMENGTSAPGDAETDERASAIPEQIKPEETPFGRQQEKLVAEFATFEAGKDESAASGNGAPGAEFPMTSSAFEASSGQSHVANSIAEEHPFEEDAEVEEAAEEAMAGVEEDLSIADMPEDDLEGEPEEEDDIREGGSQPRSASEGAKAPSSFEDPNTVEINQIPVIPFKLDLED